MAGSLKLQQFTAAQIAQEQQRGVLILDTRPAELFASAHISGAMQLGSHGTLRELGCHPDRTHTEDF